jgi:CubicO group peptidase (beta-lactamase class C family)
MTTSGRPDLDEEVRAELARLAEAAVTLAAVPGLALVVVDVAAGTSVHEEYAGVRDLAGGAPVDAATRFEIGSISKSFLAVVLLGLVREGLLDLDAPVTTYLPWFSVRSRYGPITARHLLHHTSGLVTGPDALPDDWAQVWALRETGTGSPPGTFFHYSNIGYVLLGLVAEAVTGSTAARLVASRVLGPLGMTGSTAQVRHADRAALATGYQPLHDDRPWLPGDPLVPGTWFEVAAADGNVAATAPDLGRYLLMLLAGGRPGVLDPASFTELTTSLAVGGEPSPYPSRYGLGLNTELVGGHRLLTHGGGMVGYASFVVADLDLGLGVVVLTNAPGESGAAEVVARAAYDLVRAAAAGSTGGGTGDGSPTVSPLQELDPFALPDADRFVGTYTGGDTRITVMSDGAGHLTLTDATGSGRLGRAPGGDRLVCTHEGWRTFHHDLSVEGDRTWWYGGRALLAGTEPPEAVPAALSPLVGHYRSYSPWFTNFRIVQRGLDLHLVAAGGVEGAQDDPLLVELAPGVYRIGAEPELPERLVAGPVVDGRAILVTRDGHPYSRTFTD